MSVATHLKLVQRRAICTWKSVKTVIRFTPANRNFSTRQAASKSSTKSMERSGKVLPQRPVPDAKLRQQERNVLPQCIPLFYFITERGQVMAFPVGIFEESRTARPMLTSSCPAFLRFAKQHQLPAGRNQPTLAQIHNRAGAWEKPLIARHDTPYACGDVVVAERVSGDRASKIKDRFAVRRSASSTPDLRTIQIDIDPRTNVDEAHFQRVLEITVRYRQECGIPR